MEEEFWKIIKKSGKNCDKINEIRHELKKTNPQLLENLDKIFSKYHTLIWAK